MSHARPRALLVLAIAGTALTVTACGSTSGSSPAASTTATPSAHAVTDTAMPSTSTMPSSMDGMGGMGTTDAMHTDPGRGLLRTEDGFTLGPMLPTTITPGEQALVQFRILDASGQAVKRFAVDQTKLMHFYLSRADVTGYQHLHPQLTDGVWSIPVTFAAPGPYRMYADSEPLDAAGQPHPVVLSTTFTVAGLYHPDPLPAPSTSMTVDGYTVDITSAAPMAGQPMMLNYRITRNGTPVTDLQPYLDSFAHLTAIQSGSLAYAHLHPQDTPSTPTSTGGPELSFHAEFATAGSYRLFLQFQTNGALHLAALTVNVA